MAVLPNIHSSAQIVRTLLSLVLAIALPVAAGCGHRCKQIRQQFDEAKSAELAPGGASNDSAAPQIALSVRTSYLENSGRRLVGDAIEAFLSRTRSLEVGGVRPVEVTASPELRKFSISRAKDGCPSCFRLEGVFGGELTVEMAALGTRTVPIETAFDFIAPLKLEPNPDGPGGSLSIDLGEAARHEGAPLTIELSGLRNSWRTTIERLLASRLAESLFDHLKPVRIVDFETPDFGLDSFEIQPRTIEISEDDDYATALFSISLPLSQAPDAVELAAASRPKGDRDVGLAAPHALIPAAVAVAFRENEIGRRYTKAGKADPSGPIRVTLDALRPAADSDRNRLGFELHFDAWKYSEPPPCYRLDGVARGALRVRGRELDVTLDRVAFTRGRDGLEAEDWSSAEFLDFEKNILRATLDASNLAFIPEDVELTDLAVRAEGGFISMTAAASVGNPTD